MNLRTEDIHLGYDSLSLCIEKEQLFGYIEESILEKRIFENFGYLPLYNSNKLFKANWMIFENKLYLGHTNAVFENTHYYTTDIIPEFPDEDILMFYTKFSGVLTFVLKEQSKKLLSKDKLILHLQNGVLESVL